jgi:hypothetical protein
MDYQVLDAENAQTEDRDKFEDDFQEDEFGNDCEDDEGPAASD